MNVKLEDIARLANVSKSAASLALNGKPGVSEETRATVLRIAKEHNYVPLKKIKKKYINPSSSTNYVIRFVGCKATDLIEDNYHNMPFFNELLGYFTNELKNYPFSLLISSIDSNSIREDLKRIEDEQPSDGIFLLGTNLTLQQIEEVQKIQKNLVVLDTCAPQSNLDFISINNYQGAYQAAEYLIKKGHHKVGYAESKTRIYNFSERKRGFFDAMNSHGISSKDVNIYQMHGMKIETDIENFTDLQSDSSLPTAVFCENDYIAISLIRTLSALKITVPEDISVIGFDNIPESKVITPELTTIGVNKQKIAQEAMRKMLANLERQEEDYGMHSFINTNLIERDSVV